MKNTIEHFIAWVATLDSNFASLAEREICYRLAATFIIENEKTEGK